MRTALRTTVRSMAHAGGSYTYRWPRPSLTVDCAIFSWRADALTVLLIERGNDPFKGHWALPGGFVDEHEDLDAAAARELREETHVDGLPLVQFGAFGTPGRDPRGHTVTIAYLSFAPASVAAAAGDDAARAEWRPLASAASSALAFDHKAILGAAVRRFHAELSTLEGAARLLPADLPLATATAVRAAAGDALVRAWATETSADAGAGKSAGTGPGRGCA
jgi:8-oxo-dGTP diphosphatase